MARMGLGTGTVRTVRSDAHGAFRMESLPDRLATTGVRLQANATGYRPANQSWDAGLPTGAVELRLPERLVRLTLSVLDGPTGGPLDRCRFSATKAGADRAAASFSSASPTGVYVTWLSAGSLEFLVEAPDHEPLRATVEVGPPGAEMSWTARLVPTGPAEVEVSLTVKLSDSATGEPVKAARIEVLSGETKEPVEALDTRRDDGVYLLPAPSGKHRLRVTAPGYEPYEDAIEIARDAPAVTREVRLVRLR
jgi:hypothetical protein